MSRRYLLIAQVNTMRIRPTTSTMPTFEIIFPTGHCGTVFALVVVHWSLSVGDAVEMQTNTSELFNYRDSL